VVARVQESVWGKGEGLKGKGKERSENSLRILGTVQLDLEMPPNQQHRAAVAKLLVDPAARRRGIGRALMIALEEIARSEGRTLLTLDTVTAATPNYCTDRSTTSRARRSCTRSSRGKGRRLAKVTDRKLSDWL
jgi:GNAT superfamily N-acetyltransferase